MEGIPRNHEIFEPLDFLAEMTQHIPDRGEHQIRYYGHYSNKSRGVRQKAPRAALVPTPVVPLTQQQLRLRFTWAALIKLVYEVDPLKCPKCGGVMKIVSFIEDDSVIERILRHCNLWKDLPSRGPPVTKPPPEPEEPALDYGFFDRECA